MVSTSYTFRLDPFAADYDAAVQLTEAEEASASVHILVERADWATVDAMPLDFWLTGRD